MIKQLVTVVIILFLTTALPVQSGSADMNDGFDGEFVHHQGQKYQGDREWMPFFRDTNSNGVDDLIDTSEEDHVDIYVKFDHIPSDKDLKLIEQFVPEIYYKAKYTGTIVVEDVEKSLIYSKLRFLGPVVFIEYIPEIKPFLDVSTSSIKVKPNDLYHDVWGELGYFGNGVNIAILDGGSNDNEIATDIAHESLDDMDDDPMTFDSKFIAGWDLEFQIGGELVNPHGDPVIGHGTHVAGTALGTGGREDGEYRGVAPGAQLIDMKVISDAGMGGTLIPAMEWCIDNVDRDWTTSDTNGIQIMSMSLGTSSSSDGSDTASLTANRCVEAGIVVVVAAGNDGNSNFIPSPASADKVITVGASNDMGTIDRADDDVAGFSNRGPREDDGDSDRYDELKPDLLAPGTGIMAPRVDSYAAYVAYDGTSMATPHVSGVIALMLEANPDLTPEQVKTILHKTSEGRGEPYDEELSEKYNTDFGYGLLDAYKAVKMALDDPVEDPTETSINLEVSTPADGDEVSEKVTFQGTTSTDGDITVESVRLQIQGEWKDADGTEEWKYEWNSREIDNDNITITIQASADNGSATSSTTLKLYINNTGESDDGGSDDLFDIEELQELNETTISLMAVVAVLVIISIALIVRKRKQREYESDEEDEDYSDEDDQNDQYHNYES